MRVQAVVSAVVTVGATAALTMSAATGAASALPNNCDHFLDEIDCRYEFIGAPEAFTVPPGVYGVAIQAVGAPGGSANDCRGGLAGVIRGVFPVTPGTVLWVKVGSSGEQAAGDVPGGGGFNGGGNGHSGSGGGGGASDVRIDPYNVETRIIVAAGGGAGFSGGAGGNHSQPGTTNDSSRYSGGQPGQLIVGGAGGSGMPPGEPGTLAAGGAGAGGGGGFFGGGGGGGANAPLGGGGGGSSMSQFGPGLPWTSGNLPASVTITYTNPQQPCTGSACLFES